MFGHVLKYSCGKWSSCRASEERKGTDVNFWMVGLNSTQVFCVVCKAPSVEPQVALPYFFRLFQSCSCKGYPVLVVIESLQHDFLWFSCSLRRQGLSDGSVSVSVPTGSSKTSVRHLQHICTCDSLRFRSRWFGECLPKGDPATYTSMLPQSIPSPKCTMFLCEQDKTSV